MTVALRNLTFVTFLVVFFSRYCLSKSFYIDYEEEVMPEMYTNPGTKVIEESSEPEVNSFPRGMRPKVSHVDEQQASWGGFPSPNPETSSWEMEPRQRRAKDGMNFERSFNSRKGLSSSPKLLTSKGYNGLHSNNAHAQEMFMKRQSILYSQCFFNPISCF